MRAAGTPSPVATIRPAMSAPWMRGKTRLVRFQGSTESGSASTAVPARFSLAYQPVRVLMSVLFMPAPPTAISTSSGPGSGTGTSSR